MKVHELQAVETAQRVEAIMFFCQDRVRGQHIIVLKRNHDGQRHVVELGMSV